MSVTTQPTPTGSYLMPSLDHAAVSDAMRPGVLTCDPDATLGEAARMMATQHVHSVVVTKDSGERFGGAVWGMLSHFDVMKGGLRAGPETTAKACARRSVLSVHGTTPLREAAEKMVSEGAAHALVTDPVTNRPIGVLSTLDIAGVIAWGEV